MREEIIMSSPFSRVKIPKPPKKVIATFSEKQLSAILRAVNTATPAGFREQVNDHQGDINWTRKKIILVK
jgi:site-specific recombinase XerD